MTAPQLDELTALKTATDGRYEIDREIGRGGMGIVYRARDLALDRVVAIKVLPSELAAQRELRERFLREAQTAALLAHPNVVPIHLVEAGAGAVFFVMSYIDGETLTARVRRVGALPPLDVARVIKEVSWALGYAHSRGVIHRDIKADNILVERATARTYVTDFGIARRADRAGITGHGLVLGTAQFMSPEQAAGEELDGRSDIYALGIVAYFALTGRLPFDAPTVQATLAMQLTRAPTPLTDLRAELPTRLTQIIERCLAKNRDARFSSAEELAEALDSVAAPVAEMAPVLRNWIRVAEQWQIVIWILGINSLVLVAIVPRQVVTIAVWFLAGMLWLTVDLVARTRFLQRSGFTHDDVVAAIWIEREMRLRELRAVFSDTSLAQRRKAVWRWAGLAVAGLAGTVIAGLVSSNVPRVPRFVMTFVGFASIGAFAFGLVMALASNRDLQRTNTLFHTAVWRRWFGRLFFKIVARRSDR
ncbi:MAG TPA: serine/threonine-protein kinase [Gemmatimonadales bacterium]|nr:serine/threonine-protein kinase [Gemmatimonadales bacterium]